MAWQDNTAYLYYGPWWILSGSAMMMFATSKFRVAGWRKAAFLSSFAVLLTHAILTGSRGPLFSALGLLFVSYSITRGRAVPLARAYTILAAVGFGVLLMVGFRSVLTLSEDKPEAPTLAEALDQSTDVSEHERARGETGQEFIYHAALIDTVDQTHKLEFGLGWIYFLAINPIPKLLWPEKHYPDTPGVAWQDIRDNTGLAVAPGAAPGIVADLYAQFGPGEALFLYCLGRASRKLFASARQMDSPLAFSAYVMLYAISLNMFAQGFGAIFVPFGYSMAPIVVFTLLSGTASLTRFRPHGRPKPTGTKTGAAALCS
ncbi:MAG: hypothetical protein ABSH56_13625 [Bryobacteraceae bacterium]|jgi:hypothetical protein